jgi:hypothetical protein
MTLLTLSLIIEGPNPKPVKVGSPFTEWPDLVKSSWSRLSHQPPLKTWLAA